MEVHYGFLCVFEFRGWEPAKLVIGVFVACPSYSINYPVTATAAVDFAVDDFCDFVFEFAVDFDGRWRWLHAMREGVGLHWLEESYVEYVMNLVHCARESESVCVSRYLLGDGEGA